MARHLAGELAALLWFAGLIAFIALATWSLKPLDARAQAGRRRIQFTLADWCCLILMVQIWAAVVHSVGFFGAEDDFGTVRIDLLGWILIAIMWYSAVWRLTSAGVSRTRHRVAIQLFVYPVSVLGAVITPSLLSGALANSFAPSNDRMPPGTHTLFAVGGMVFAGAMLGCGHYVRKIVAEATAESRSARGSGKEGQHHEDPDPEQSQADRKHQ